MTTFRNVKLCDRLRRQLLQHRLLLHQIARVEAFGKQL